MIASLRRASGWLVLFTTTLLVLTARVAPAQQDGIFDDEPLAETPEGQAPAEGTEGAAGTGTDPQAELNQKLAEADALMQQQNWAGAIEIYNQILAVTRDPRALLGQGVCFARLGSTELAVSSISQAIITPGIARLEGFLENAFLERGKLYLSINRYREAADDFSQAKQNNPASFEASLQYAKAKIRQTVTSPSGGMDQPGQEGLLDAVRSLEQAIKQKSDLGEAYLERGRALFRLRQFDLAISDLQQAVRLMGANSEASADLGIALAMRATQASYEPAPDQQQIAEDLRAADQAMDGFLQTAPLGKTRLPWEVQDPMQQEPEKILLQQADVRVSLAAEVPAEERESLYRQAIADADRLLALDAADEDLARAHYIRGLALRMLNDLPGATSSLTRAIQLYQSLGATYGEAYLRRGICYFHQGQMEMALQDFQAASANPNNPYAYEPRAMYWTGVVQSRLGDYQSAIRSYTRAVSASPRYLPAFLNRGLAYLNVGRYDQAIEDFDTVLRQDPDNRDALRFRDLATARR
jgi:tetratricopeptide (TPR) repeat protein